MSLPTTCDMCGTPLNTGYRCRCGYSPLDVYAGYAKPAEKPLRVEGLDVAETRILELTEQLGSAEATISRLTAERDRLASELEVSNAAHAATGRLLADTGRKMLGMKAALELWLAYADENLFDFDFDEPCDGDVVCYECQNSGCISLKIRETRAALATPAVSDAESARG